MGTRPRGTGAQGGSTANLNQKARPADAILRHLQRPISRGPDEDYGNILQQAICYEYVRVVDAMLQVHTREINRCDMLGRTPLHNATLLDN